MNNFQYELLEDGKLVSIKSQDIRVGQIVKVTQG